MSCNPVAGHILDSLNPLVVTVVGSNSSRDTWEDARKAGLKIDSVED